MASGKCKSCIYSRPLSGTSSLGLFCDYIGIVGTRRPCEGGEKCKVYEKRGNNYKPPKENLDYLWAK